LGWRRRWSVGGVLPRVVRDQNLPEYVRREKVPGVRFAAHPDVDRPRYSCLNSAFQFHSQIKTNLAGAVNNFHKLF
jgi:hypothetical protein